MSPVKSNSLLSQFRAIASSTVFQQDDVAVVFAKSGNASGTLTARKISKIKSNAAENREMRHLLYRALSESGASSALLQKAYGLLNLGDPKESVKPLTNRTVISILKSQVEEDFTVKGDGVDGFSEISRTGDLLKPNAKDAIRGPETLRTRDKLKAFILDHAAHQGISLTRQDLAKLKVAGLRAVARIITSDEKTSADQLKSFIAQQSDESGQVLQNETLDALARLKTDKAFADSVTFKPEFKEVKGGTAFKDFLADLVLDFDVSEHDSGPSALRMAKTLLKHEKLLPLLLTTSESMLKAQIPIAAFSTLREIRLQFARMLGVDIDPKSGKMTVQKDGKVQDFGFQENFKRVGVLVNELKNCVATGTVSDRITLFEGAVQRHVAKQAERMQNLMGKLFGAIMTGESPNVREMVGVLDPELLSHLEEKGVPLPQKVDAPKKENAPFGAQKMSPEQVREAYARKKIDAQTEIAKLNAEYQKKLQRAKPVLDKDVEERIRELEARRDEELRKAPDQLRMTGLNDAEIARNLEAYRKAFEDEISELRNSVKSQVDADAEVQRLRNEFEPLIEKWTAELVKIETAEQSEFDTSDFEFIGKEGHYRQLSPAELKKLGNGIEREEYDLWRLANTRLDDLAQPGLDPSMGYGKFLMDAVQMYFKSSQPIDQRTMLASMIRNTPTKDQMVKVIEPNGAQSLFGSMLGAYFKGAGPLMQKQLQLFSSLPGIPPSFKEALADMRSNLPPMSTETVHALLADVVAKSNGAIKKLEVLETLGAASVAQSVLCKMTTADGKTREVVVKLIRPDAENRVKREEVIFLEAAQNNGMTETFKGRLKTIYEEFELGIEQKNAKAGGIYDKPGVLTRYRSNSITAIGTEPYNDVHSVKIDPLSPPGGSAMIMSVAPGKPVDRMMASVEKELAELKESEKQLDNFQAEERRESICAMKRRYLKAHAQVEQSYRQVAHFIRTWLGQGLFGSGFYHGDAHAGNIMVDLETDPTQNKGLTVIDFGNATQITKDESKNIKLVMTACFISNVDDFISSYRAMLSPEGEAHFAANEKVIRDHLARIFAKGKGAADAGDIAMAALNELQRMGVETPSALFNFIQGFTLLMGTLSQLDIQLTNVQSAMKSFDEGYPDVEFEEAEKFNQAKSSITDYPIGEILMGVIRENIVATGFTIGPSGIVKVAKAMKKV